MTPQSRPSWRRKAKRNPSRPGSQLTDKAGFCPDCRKMRFNDRAAAKRYAKRMGAPGDELRPYRCPVWDQFFHLGHLDDSIIRGERTREVYEGKLPGAGHEKRRQEREREEPGPGCGCGVCPNCRPWERR